MSSRAVEQIKERLSILDVIGTYVSLQKAGKNYKGKSPFTNEKTPSFFVSPGRGMYYCFSSQKGGDMFTFIQEMEGVDFKGALKILAEKAHVELVPEDPKQRDAREVQFALLEDATQYFFDNLHSNPHVETYVHERGVLPHTIHTWRIGYALDEWRSLRNYLYGKGYTDDQMKTAGLIKSTEQGKDPYDVFRDRVMFPIMDPNGRVIAFSGRTLKNETGVPKYVNSPETDLYKKSHILYGYHRAKHTIRQYDFSLIVEGQFDLVLSHQAGYTNTVAVSGTAFTDHHMTLLTRLSNRVVLALDSDKAGIAAIQRVSAMLLSFGADVKVAKMPFGKDPADVVRQDPHELKHAVGNATHSIEFLLEVCKTQSRDDRTYKLRVREELLPIVARMENRIDREHFEHIIADATHTTHEAVHYEVNRIIDTTSHSAQNQHQDITQPQSVSATRKAALVKYLFSFIHASIPEYQWIQNAVADELLNIFGSDAYEELKSTFGYSSSDTFSIEEAIVTMRERDIVSALNDQLTALAHTIARERLTALKSLLSEAEITDNESLLASTLLKTKDAELLLKSHIELRRPV